MEIIFDLFNTFTDPDWIINNGGLYLVALILFVETGLFFGFFLPGDPLLFIAGLIIAQADPTRFIFDDAISNLVFWCLLFILATIIGNMVGYWSGRRFLYFFKGKDKKGVFLKMKHVEMAEHFYKKNGGFAIVIARFLPLVRTFVPIVAGMVKMKKRPFMLYNCIGAFLWVGIITTLGFVLGENIWVQQNLEWVILALILVVTAPVLIKIIKAQFTLKNANS